VNWDAVTAITEMVGAIGVIVSLVYLAVQVRQNTRVARAATRQAIAGDLQALPSDLVEGDDAARIFHAHVSGEPVKPHEKVRLLARAYRDLHFWDNAHYQYQEGMLTVDEWRGIRENCKQLLLHVPAYREYWDGEGSSFPERFRIEMAQMLSEEYEGAGETVMGSIKAGGSGNTGDS